MESPTVVECSICTKTFSRPADLRRHMKTHDREKFQFTCPYEGCTHKALQRNNLKTHLNTHTGERPHECPEDGCTFSTGDPGSLTRHRKRVHGYKPKGKSGTRKQTRQQRRVAPYSSPSTTTTSGSSGSASPVDPSLEVSQAGTPASEIPCILDQTAPLSRVASSGVESQNSKNIVAAYNTQLIPKYPEVNDSQAVASGAQTQEALSLQSASMTEEAEPPVEGYSQLSLPEQTQQRTLSTFNLPAEPLLPEVNGTTNASFNDFILPLHGQEALTPSYINPTMQHTGHNLLAPTSASFTSYGDQPYSVNDAYYLPSPANLPAHGNSYMVESAPYEQYGYPTGAASFDAIASYPSSSTPNTSAYAQALHPQALEQTYSFYTTPMEMSGWPMQESYF